jgi:hypothetical protein
MWEIGDKNMPSKGYQALCVVLAVLVIVMSCVAIGFSR